MRVLQPPKSKVPSARYVRGIVNPWPWRPLGGALVLRLFRQPWPTSLDESGRSASSGLWQHGPERPMSYRPRIFEQTFCRFFCLRLPSRVFLSLRIRTYRRPCACTVVYWNARHERALVGMGMVVPYPGKLLLDARTFAVVHKYSYLVQVFFSRYLELRERRTRSTHSRAS